jgi:RNA polymerase sigma-70 factor, ECF subfamily
VRARAGGPAPAALVAAGANGGQCVVAMDAEPRVLGAIGAEVPPVGRRRERTLIKAAQRGSEEALEELFRRHWRAAHRAAFLVVHDGAAAEDIAQEAFIAAVRALDRFDRRRPFGPWLHRIVVNRSIDWSRARKARMEVSGDAVELHAASADVDLAALADADRVVAALGSLGPEQRAVVVLRYLLDYTPGEIAELLEIPRGTVNSRLRRGLDALASELPEERPG